MRRVLGIVLFLIGLWIFLGPFIGPAMHMSLVEAPAKASMQMQMGHMNMGNTKAVVVNRAMVFFDLLPGALLMLIGIYQTFKRPTARTVAY